jgi:hypothetical protein
MPRLDMEHPAEEFLHKEELIQHRSFQRRALLGCIGCRWLKADAEERDIVLHGRELVKCTGLQPGTVYPILRALEATGVMVSEGEAINPVDEGRPARVLYRPAESVLGREFWTTLQVPAECPLEADRQG